MKTGQITLWLGLIIVLAYLVGHYVFGKDPAITVVYSLIVGCAVTISLNWMGNGIGHARRGLTSGASNILFSTWLTWTVLFAAFAYSASFLILGRPEWLRDTPIYGLISSLLVVSGVVAVLTPVNTEEEIAKPSLVSWFVAVALGFFVAGALMTAAFFNVINWT
jgi:hypothetical protein